MAAPMNVHKLRDFLHLNGRFCRFSVGAVTFVRYAARKPPPPTVPAPTEQSPNDPKKFYNPEDGTMKRSGLLVSPIMTADGKPVYPGKHKTVRLEAGSAVRAGMMLLQQKRLDFHPGLYVGLGRDLTLYAYEDGVVYVTCEKVAFDWGKDLVRRFYFDQRDMNTYKMYYHVIPKAQHNKFKLISQT